MMVIEKLSLTSDKLTSHRQLACCPFYCGIPFRCKDLMIYNHMDTKQKPLLLTGHHGEITAMVFGTGSKPVYLCSASADYVIVWDIELCQKRTREGRVASGTVIATSLGEVVHLTFCFADERVAACSGTAVYILSSKREEGISTLTGHLGLVTAAEFCPWDKDILVTISEDRTFMVWDLNRESVCYKSFVLSASPLLSVFLLERSRHLITGSADGQVWCFSLTEVIKCHLVSKMDIDKMQKRHIRLQAATDEGACCLTEINLEEVETTKPVIKMSVCGSTADTYEEQGRDNRCLWIGSSDGCYLVDLATSDLLTALYFKDYPELSIKMAGSWSISPGWNNSVVCLVSSLFTTSVVLLEVTMPAIETLCDHLRRAWIGNKSLTVIPSSPPIQDSPLNAELKKREPSRPKTKGKVKAQPLVFHSKVKSSGYTTSPRSTMFSPKTNVDKTQSFMKSIKKRSCVLRDYPEDSPAPSIKHTQLSIADKLVCCFQYSGNGKQILCGLGDNTVLLFKSSFTGSPAVCTGHDKAVSGVGWSHSGQWWLSASEDRTLRIWPNGGPEPTFIMSGDTFSKPVRSPQFYYLDKFLLLASGNSLYLYLHHLDNTHDDVKRYQQRSTVKLASCFEIPTTDITALSSVNDFFSYIVLVCGSDRSIQVFDMNKGAVSSRLPEAHSRATHCISLNKGSMFAAQAPKSYNLFLTSALTDGIKLWDIRTLRCVRRYDNHISRCHPCTSAISPCGRFIASGSEDNCAYVYDIRNSSYLHKLKHSDPVFCVTFNPARPELLTGTLDGKLCVFGPSGDACL